MAISTNIARAQCKAQDCSMPMTEEGERAEIQLVVRKLLTPDDTVALNKRDLRLLRNGIFALHGRTFQDPELSGYFQTRPWYFPKPQEDHNLIPQECAAVALILHQENVRRLEELAIRGQALSQNDLAGHTVKDLEILARLLKERQALSAPLQVDQKNATLVTEAMERKKNLAQRHKEFLIALSSGKLAPQELVRTFGHPKFSYFQGCSRSNLRSVSWNDVLKKNDTFSWTLWPGNTLVFSPHNPFHHVKWTFESGDWRIDEISVAN
jgi:hypothetical protein